MARIEPVKTKLKDGIEITLRSPVPEDAEAFIAYCAKIFSTSPYVATQPEEYTPNLEKQKESIKAYESKPGSVGIIAEHDGKIIGNIDFRSYAHRKRYAHRGDFGMSVLEDWRGKGVGRALLRQLIDWARTSRCGIEKIELSVMQKNAPAVKLYESFGFKNEGLCTGQFKLEDGSYMDGITMGLWII